MMAAKASAIADSRASIRSDAFTGKRRTNATPGEIEPAHHVRAILSLGLRFGSAIRKWKPRSVERAS